jgi:hypothetical protein
MTVEFPAGGLSSFINFVFYCPVIFTFVFRFMINLPMQKKVIPWFLAVILFTCVWCISCFGQSGGTTGKQGDLSKGGRSTGFYNVTTFIPVTFSGQFLGGIQTVCGYNINRYLSIGGGIGYERFISIPTYEDFKADLLLLPVFVDFRFTPLTGKISPVIALDAGYKFLLNKPPTQIRYDTVYGNILGFSSRNDNSDYNIFTHGGPFITAEAGVKARVFRKVALYLAVDYSLWSVSGDYYLANRGYILGSGGWSQVSSTETADKSTAYVHAFFVRLGIAF